jgi:hypothetical protein
VSSLEGSATVPCPSDKRANQLFLSATLPAPAVTSEIPVLKSFLFPNVKD